MLVFQMRNVDKTSIVR
ncbi:23S rRNA methyltransferase attenuation leader peptide [Streptococcus infantis]